MEYLACPVCYSELGVDSLCEEDGQIKEGIIKCVCGMEYPVVGYIPRFIADPEKFFPDFYKRYPQYIRIDRKGLGKAVAEKEEMDFEFHWRKFGSLETNNEKLKVAREFFSQALEQPLGDFFNRRLLLDVGCGDGVHEEIFKDIDCQIVGYDISRSVDYAHSKFCLQPNIHFLQIDIENLPFKRHSFDYIFSVGTLYYVSSPKYLFKKLFSYLKPCGYFHLWMYPKRNFLWDSALKAARFVTTRLPNKLVYYLCFPLSFLLYVLPVYSRVNLGNSSFRECAHLFWMHLKPRFLHTFNKNEITSWFNENNFQDVKSYGEPISIIGKNKGEQDGFSEH